MPEPSSVTPESPEAGTSGGQTLTNLSATAPFAGDTPSAVRLPFQALGHYELIDVISQGGMGLVCTARHTILDKVYALKMIANGVLATPAEVQWFLREVRAVSELDHPNIVRVFEIGCENNQHFFTMSYLPGGSLNEKKQEYSDPRAAAALVEKLARAVHFAHQKGIVHRDLKPSNVLMEADGEPRISDFGLAKLLDDDGRSLSVSGQVLGTPDFMSPEQAQGKKEAIGPATDVWSLGVILYELVVGRRPFRGATRDVLLARIIEEEPTFPGNVRPDCPSALEQIILQCLEKDPSRRYPTALALAEDLRRFLASEKVAARIRFARRFPRGGFPVRKLIAAVALVTLLAIGLLAFLVPRPAARVQAPRNERGALLDRLRAKERVELIGAAGMPRWFDRALGTGELTLPEGDPTLPPVLVTWRYALIELVPDPCSDSYELYASIRQETSHDGETGIYLLGTENEIADGTQCRYVYTINFADQGDLAGWIYFYAWRVGGDNLVASSRIKSAALPKQTEEWRDLKVHVTPEQIVVFLNGAELWTVAPEQLTGRVSTMTPGQKPGTPAPQLERRRPIGIFGYKTETVIRNFIIQPL